MSTVAPEPVEDAFVLAQQLAEVLVQRGTSRLGLVAADRGADALAVAGWQGPLNHTNDTGELCAVLRDWEDRFGVRVVGADFATLYLSVAAPPRSEAEAIRVAAEHFGELASRTFKLFAFCPDNVWQSSHRTLVDYARSLVDGPVWRFWWD